MVFSVIIPVYNVEKYLKECVNSVLRQTFTDFELILVDDGSKDGSSAICDEYAKCDNRIQVIHKKNGGQSSARNIGVSNAKGKYVVFLDSDDLICSDSFLEELHSKTIHSPDVIVYRYYKYWETKISDCGISYAGITQRNKADFLYELVKRDAFFCSCWSKTIRSDLLKEHNIVFDETLSCEDMDWYYSVIEHAKSFEIIDKPYVYYRQRENSVTSVFKQKSITDYVLTLKKWKKKFENIESDREREVLLSSLAKLYCNLLISYSRHRKELKELKRDIWNFKGLLRYRLNPRANKFYLCTKFLGMNLTCTLLCLIDKMR